MGWVSKSIRVSIGYGEQVSMVYRETGICPRRGPCLLVVLCGDVAVGRWTYDYWRGFDLRSVHFHVP